MSPAACRRAAASSWPGWPRAGPSLVLGASAKTARAENPGDWYALVSDIHIAAEPATRLRGEVMADNLRAVVADILAADAAPAPS